MCISGMGLICAAGNFPDEVFAALMAGKSALAPPKHFQPLVTPCLPVGEVPLATPQGRLPRTHWLARRAAAQAMVGAKEAPDAIVLGITTGGMALTEALLKANVDDPSAYARHAVGSVARDLVDQTGCRGPVLTISTACSSGAVALHLAARLIQRGLCRRVLAGGADCLCRLTYYGFKSLQLLDENGARPLCKDRRGMSVAEGAALLFLEDRPPGSNDVALLGGGLSCDAFHAAKPHPEGEGAAAAIRAALADAGVDFDRIDYVNLHGTGTPDNDLAEARALQRIAAGRELPPHSSIKGAVGHPLAAAGAMEAVIAALTVKNGQYPPNTGCNDPDPALGVDLKTRPRNGSVDRVLSNSFGFGGNNAALVIGRATEHMTHATPANRAFAIRGYAALSGEGATRATLAALLAGKAVGGCADPAEIDKDLDPLLIRRLKRLPRMALALTKACGCGPTEAPPTAIYFGTGWGALSETHDFLDRLFKTEERFPSPMDFIGSVHNAPAGQIALWTGATKDNLTTTCPYAAFEQALLSAELLQNGNGSVLLLAADEAHSQLSPRLDPDVAAGARLADGGGALRLDPRPDPKADPKAQPEADPKAPCLRLLGLDYAAADDGAGSGEDPTARLSRVLSLESVSRRYGLVLAGLPAACRTLAETQLAVWRTATGYEGPLIDYRRQTGDFATATALATVWAAALKDPLRPDTAACPPDKGILILNLGTVISAMEVAACMPTPSKAVTA
ncbi:MAG: beta-ketoacyl synthase N-terminal-like domain-containing protein [Desulfosarcinaceae bacterium]